MRLAFLLLTVPFLAEAQTPLQLEFRVGPVVSFGSSAEKGTKPFAQLRTVSTIKGPVTLLTWTRLTAAPGSEFNIQSVETFQAIDFELALAYQPKGWNAKVLFTGGVQARAFEDDNLSPPASRRMGLGILVSSTTKSWIALFGGYDERHTSSWGTWLSAGAEVAPGISLIGTGIVGRSTATLKLAAAVGWK